MLRAVPLALAAALLLALSVSGTAPAAGYSKHCIPIRFAGTNYPVWVTQGATSCKTARRTLLSFMKTKKQPRNWVCFRGYAGVVFAASCARRPGTGKAAVLRAYNPGYGG